MKTIAFINSKVNKDFVEVNIPNISCGEANGYVAVPQGHPLYGKGIDDIDGIDVHGGISCSGYINKDMMQEQDTEFLSDETKIPSDWWVFGFDTMHFGDNCVNWPKERVKEETLWLQEQLESI